MTRELRQLAWALIFGASVLCAATGAQAQDATAAQSGEETLTLSVETDSDDLVWIYPEVRWWQYVIMFTAPIALELIEVAWGEGADEPRWTGGILFDDEVRDVLVGRTRKTRDFADFITDAAMMAMWITPTVLEGIITALLIEREPEVAWQMIAINIQAYASSALITLGLIRAVARERPMAAECELDESYSDLCGSQHTRSFPSGHTASTFMGAGLICAHHLHLDLWGSPGDEIACGSALVLATATGLVRLTADRHYFSDIVAGAAIGLSMGWLVPWLLHYSQPIGVDPAAQQTVVAPMISEDLFGLQAGTTF